MPEILFIANDPCILTLIENLQQLVETGVALESDYTSGVKRIFETLPAAVFLQHKIGNLACDKVANQVNMLLQGEAIPLVLLSDESVTSYSVISTYAACFDLCLPAEELSRQVQKLLRTLPQVTWKHPVTDEPPVSAPSAIEGTLELRLPTDELDFSALLSDVPARAAESGSIPTIEAGTLPDLEGNAIPAAEPSFIASTDNPALPAEFQAGALDIEPHSIVPPLREKEPSEPPVLRESTLRELHHIERAAPDLVFGSMSEPTPLPSFSAGNPSGPKPAGKTAAPAATRGKATAKKTDLSFAPATPAAPTGPGRQTVAARPEPQPSWAPEGDDLSEAALARLGIKRTPLWYRRGAVIAFGLVICVVSLPLFFTRHIGKPGPPPAPGARTASQSGLPQAAKPAAAQELPLFIPQVPPDPAYAVQHPGWERYQADGLQYLVYREHSAIRAIQVLSGQPGTIGTPFLKTCIRLSTGNDRFVTRKTEERSGIQISTCVLQNGGELLVYRAVASGEIRGFVMSFPAAGSALAQPAKVSAR